MELVVEDGHEILVEYLLLLVRHRQEPLVSLVQLLLRERVSQLLAGGRASPCRPVRAVSTTRLSIMPTSSGRMIS